MKEMILHIEMRAREMAQVSRQMSELSAASARLIEEKAELQRKYAESQRCLYAAQDECEAMQDRMHALSSDLQTKLGKPKVDMGCKVPVDLLITAADVRQRHVNRGANNKVAMIMELRAGTGSGIKEAKDAIEAVFKGTVIFYY